MNSMTGYGRGAASDDTLEVALELNTVNRKGLDIHVSLPRDWQTMEKSVLEAIRKELARGKVSVSIQVKDRVQGSGLTWDEEAVATTIEQMKSLAEAQKIPFEPSADFLLRLVTSLGSSSQLPESEEAWPIVAEALQQALKEASVMRAQEGEALLQDLNERLELMQSYVTKIEELSEGTVEHYRELLFQRLKKAHLELDIEDERVLKEISIFADRCDITEEFTRLKSHFAQFLETIQDNAAVGRKLDFLCQEINREINTIGSKANSIEITKHVLECKNELERIREQVQNVE